MKNLHLIRHAKSSWKDAERADRDRPLKRRGRRDAEAMSGFMRGAGFQCDAIFCSPAARAVQTLEIMRPALGLTAGEIHFEEALYTFDGDDLRQWLARQTLGSIAMVGHNPAFADLTGWLSGSEIEKFPTAAWCWLMVDRESWSAIEAGCATIKTLVVPRDLR